MRNSALPGLTEAGSGSNGFALEVAGGSTTAIRPLDDASTQSNTPGTFGRIPIAEIPSWYAGHTISFDPYDPGDSNSPTEVSIQVLAPPGRTPDASATTIPSPGIASACHYNATPSDTRAPATPDVSTDCSVVTHLASLNTRYNGKWLRIDVTLDPAYTCVDDCTWRLATNITIASPVTNRITWCVTANP